MSTQPQSQPQSQSPSVAERLAAIRAEKARILAEFTALRDEAAEAAELERAELDLANEKALMAAAVKYGPIGVKWDALMTRMGVIIVKRSSDPHFRAYQEDAEFSFEKTEAFVRRCIEYPDLVAFDAIVRELPGVLADLSNAICKLMGMRAAEQVKK